MPQSKDVINNFMKMFDEDEPTPYEVLIANTMHIEHLSGIVVDLTNQIKLQNAEIARLRSDLIKMAMFNQRITNNIKELTDYVTAKKS